MTEHTPKLDFSEDFTKTRINRRQLLRYGAIAALPIATALTPWLRYPREVYYRDDDKERVQAAFETGITSEWSDLAAFPGLIQIDPSAPVTDGIFGDQVSIEDYTEHDFLVAIRPMGVRRILEIHAGVLGIDSEERVNSVLARIPKHLLTFYPPNSERLVYLDADADPGLVTPITTEAEFARLFPGRVPVYDITIDGREVRDGGVVYPYTQRLDTQLRPGLPDFSSLGVIVLRPQRDYQGVVYRKLIGHSNTFHTVSEFNDMVNKFLDGAEPLGIPGP